MSSETDSQTVTRMVHPTLGGSTPFWRGMTLPELGLFVLDPFETTVDIQLVEFLFDRI